MKGRRCRSLPQTAPELVLEPRRQDDVDDQSDVFVLGGRPTLSRRGACPRDRHTTIHVVNDN